MFTTTEAAHLLGKQYFHLTYLLKTKKLPEVARFNNRRIFTPGDILSLARAFNFPEEKVAALADRLEKGCQEGEQGINK